MRLEIRIKQKWKIEQSRNTGHTSLIKKGKKKNFVR